MQLSNALEIINNIKTNDLETLTGLLPLLLIEEAYALTETVTLRKRKITLESIASLLIGMVIYKDKSMANVVNMIDIIDRESKPFVALSALTHSLKQTQCNSIVPKA